MSPQWFCLSITSCRRSPIFRCHWKQQTTEHWSEERYQKHQILLCSAMVPKGAIHSTSFIVQWLREIGDYLE
ncbi:hypothetical protein GN956_G13938 [Arapaima gigas]